MPAHDAGSASTSQVNEEHLSPIRPRQASRQASLSSTPTNGYATFDTHTPLLAAAEVEARLSAATPRGAGGSSERRAQSESRRQSSGRKDRNSRRRLSRMSDRRPSSQSLAAGGAGARARRSISQALLRAVGGDDSEEEEWSDDGHGGRRSLRRSSTTYFLSHPTSYAEAIATYSPRVSAVIRPSGTHTPERDGPIRRRSSHHERNDGDTESLAGAVEILEINDDIPYGVRKMEILSRYMTKPYLPIYIITLFTSLSSTTTPAVEPYFLSLFGGHAYISSIAIVTSIAYAVCKPPMAKVLDTFGRAEGLAVSAVLYGVGHILVSSSRGIVTFAVARVIGSAGAQGINLAQQVIVADITSLASRALVTSTIFLPWLLTPWLGPPLGQLFKDAGEAGYRSAYTLFGVAVPLSCLFLLFFLWTAYRRVLKIAADSKPMLEALKATTQTGETVQADDALTWKPRGVAELAVEARKELDLFGIFLLMLGTTLFLLPLSLAATSAKAWRDPLYPSLVLAGLALLGLLAYHETYVAAYPLIPTRLIKDKTVMAGCALGAFHFFCQFAYESYFPSFLQVARYYSARDASYIAQSYVFSASIAALGCGLLVKWTRRYKIFMVTGVLLHMVGAFLMVRFRSLNNTTFEIVVSQLIGGLGGGFTTLGAQLGVQAVVGHQDVAIVTASFLTITQIGGAVGGAASGAIWSTFLPRKLSEYLPDMAPEDIRKIFGSISVAMSYERGTLEREAINQAYVETQRLLNLAALAGLLPALVAALLMKNVKLSREEGDERVVALAEVIDDSEMDSETDTGSSVASFEHTPLRRSR